VAKLGEILLQEKKLTADELKLGLDLQKKNPQVRLGAILKQLHFTDYRSIAEITARQYTMPFHSGQYTANLEVLERLKANSSLEAICFLTEHKVYPLKDTDKPVFVLALADDTKTTDFLRNECGFEDAEFRIGIESEINNALDVLILEEMRRKTNSMLVEIEDTTNVDSLARWFEKMISKAIMYRATDIHVEPTPLGVQIRFRIDGKLRIACCMDRSTMNAISNIVLVKCQKDPSAFLEFHDGRFDYKYFDRCVDVRVSQVPSVHGPSLVLRLLDKEQASYSIQSLGYSDLNSSLIAQAVARPHGIILVTGPTGCGKSTTLTAILDDLINTERKVMTIEDPIERVIPGGTQVQMDANRNITFASAIRSFLRQDPDIMLVGEIRDEETAQESIRASATGHLIFSTLHTNNPVSAILRLLDLGISRINISNNIIAIVSQRLVCKLCPYCKKEILIDREKVTPAEKQYLKEERQRIYIPQGCDKCFNGYRGRTVVAETLLLNDGIRELIDHNRINEIASLLRAREDYRNIKYDAQCLVAMGITSLEEATRHLG
jgi:type II secretory ATPase GspE/PulE/Tfp pilus assembly ATPase PilB-like protein